MKIIIALLCLALTPMLLFAKTNDSVGDTHENGIVIPSQQSNLEQTNKKFIQDFFTWLDAVSKSNKPISKKDFLKYFDAHVIYTVNNKTVAFDAARLLSRFLKLKKAYNKTNLVLPIKIIIVAGDHVAVHYQIDIQNLQDQNYIDDVAVLITLHKQKIVAWRAVIAHHDE